YGTDKAPRHRTGRGRIENRAQRETPPEHIGLRSALSTDKVGKIGVAAHALVGRRDRGSERKGLPYSGALIIGEEERLIAAVVNVRYYDGAAERTSELVAAEFALALPPCVQKKISRVECVVPEELPRAS